MRLLLVYHRDSHDGIEQAVVKLAAHTAPLIKSVVLLLPPGQIGHFRKLVGREAPACRGEILFEPYDLGQDTWQLWIYQKIRSFRAIAKKYGLDRLCGCLGEWMSYVSFVLPIRSAIKKHGVTHCLYTHTMSYSKYVPEVGKNNFLTCFLIHDLWWLYPGMVDKGRYDREAAVLSRFVKASDMVITISEQSKKEVLHLFPWAGEKIENVYWGFNDVVTQNARGRSEETAGRKIFFYPAKMERGKNHLLVLKALKKLLREGVDVQVVFSGRQTDLMVSREPQEKSCIEECRLFIKEYKELFEGHLEVLGYCSRDTVENMYSAALRVLFPSNYEGFGLPIVEAIGFGKDIICSDIPVFKEIVDFFGIRDMVTFFKVDDEESLACEMKKAIHVHIIPKSKEDIASILKRWTWDDVAKRYVELLRNL